jgi:poly(A) polymerase
MMRQLPFAPWATTPETARVMDALDAMRPGVSRFVGGCVRNAVMGKPADDIDIATQLLPQQTIAAAQDAGLGAHPTGIDHGTVTLVCQGRPFEVTTLRRDVSTDGRRASVAFTEDWVEDAQRRDFTLNALYADRQGVLFDPIGTGVEDALAGRVRFIGDADRRIAEDYLRILRFFRFSAWYGRGVLDKTGLLACQRGVPGMAQLSAERVWKELKKLLAASDPRGALDGMTSVGAHEAVWPMAGRLDRVNALIGLEAEAFLPADPLRRVAAALPDLSATQSFCLRMKASSDERERLCAAQKSVGRIVSHMSLREMRRTLYRLGAEAFLDQAALAWADDRREKTTPQWRALTALAQGWKRPVFPLNGAQVLAAGAPAGPLVGEVLREVEEWWIDADFVEDPLGIAERLKAVVQGLC